MNKMSISHGYFALALLARWPALPVRRQTTYYNWQGGSGGTATSNDWMASGGTTWASGTGFLTGLTQNQPWVQDNTSGGSASIATFGYLSTSGSGSTIRYQIYDFTTPTYFTAIALDPNNVINANSLIFGTQPPAGTSTLGQYGLTGGTLNLTANGTGNSPNITFDMATNPPANSDSNVENSISSNLLVGGGTGTLSFCVASSYSNVGTPHGDNAVGNLFLSGSNQFAAAIVGGIAPDLEQNYSALVFMNTQSLNFKGQVPNITLGNLAEVVYMGPNLSSGTIGTVTLDPTVGLNSAPSGASLPSIDHVLGAYTRNTGQYTYGTNGAGCLARIGAGTTNSTASGNSYPTLYVGAITGQGDVEFATSYASDGGGVVVLTQTSSYTGDTFLAQASTRAASATASVPMVRIGVNNALPIGTNLIFGDLGVYSTAYNGGALDLNGMYQQVASLDTSNGTSTNQFFAGINNYAAGTGTLAICNNVPQFNTIEAQFHAIIGKQLLDGTSGRLTSGSASNNNIALALLPGNNGTLTLGLGYYSPSGSTIPFSQANTYNGGTTISGGALFASNGTTYWDGTHGIFNNGAGGLAASSSASALNSATGTGPVVVNAGGTFGGSKIGGAVGMPGTGPVTINSGGYLLPGGGYYMDSTGNGAGGWVTNGGSASVYAAVPLDPDFTPTVGPAFHVLGNLNLNAGASVNFNFSGTSYDQVAVGGALNLPASGGTVAIGINNLGGGQIPNGVPLFNSFTSLSVNGGSLANLSTLPDLTLVGLNGTNLTGDSLKLVGNQIDLVTGGTVGYVIWNGSIANSGSYAWDKATQNFSAAGTPTTYNDADTAVFDDSAANTVVTVTSTGVSPTALLFNNNIKTYTIQGGAIKGNVGPVIQGGGTVIFSNSNTYSGTTTIQQGSTLQVNSAATLPAGGAVNLYGYSTLTLGYTDNGSSTYNGTINIETGSGAPAINVPNGTVTLAGAINSPGAVGLTKTGSGTLLLTDAQPSSSIGANNIDGGFVELNSVFGANAGASYTALGQGNLNVAYAGGATGGGVWLNNVQLGVNQNQSSTDQLGWFRLYTGGVLKGTGTGAAVASTNVEAVLNYTAGSGYAPGTVYLATGTSPSDSLSLKTAFEQFDPNYFQANEYVNYIGGGTAATANANYLITSHVQGAGTVKLQSGDLTSANAFGGAWSVDSGVLQVGPFVSTTAALPTSSGTVAGQWAGAGGEVFNALGFKVAYTSTGNMNGSGNPDLPNAVTVNAGGMLAIANDQIDGNGVALTTGPNNPYQNGTPAYYRNLVTLSGGTLAATGAEVTWNYASSAGSASQGVMSPTNSGVVARLGGGFSGASGSTSTILTYDPTGYSAANGIARTVDLVGGTRVLNNASPGLPLISGSGSTTWSDSSLGFASVTSTSSSVTLQYETNWAGNLLIASSGGIGGTFNIERSGGSISVASGAAISVQPNSTVNISNDDQSTLVMSTSLNSTYGFLVSGTGGTLPVLNNVLSAGGNSVAIANSGTFNVNAGTQTVGAITGNGTFNVTSTATATAPSISQALAGIGPSATLNLTGPGVVASSLILANSGNLNVSGGSHTVGTVGVSSANVGATSVSGPSATLSAAQVYQNSATASNGGAIVLTASYTGNLSSFNSINVQSGKIDVGQSGFFLPNGDASGTGAIFNQIKAGYAGGTWSGSNGVTSSLAASNPNSYAVGYAPVSTANGTQILVATTIPGDATLEGTVTGTDKLLVSGTDSNYGKSGLGWSQGNFTYDQTIGNNDRAAVIRNLGKSYNPPSNSPIVPAGGPPVIGPDGEPTLATQQIDYNPNNGQLSLVVDSTADLDAFSVYLQNPPASANPLPNNWQLALESDSLQYGKQTVGDLSETLQPGTYLLADLASGLSPSAFGNGANGAGNASGAVLFYDSSYNSTASNVTFVPEPGTFALVIGAAVAGGLVWRRKRRQAVVQG